MRKLALALLVAGCAGAGANVVPGPSGQPAYSVWCRRSIDNCYREAGRLCPSGYQIVNRSSGDVSSVPTANGPQIISGPDGLLIECRGAVAAR